MAEVASATFSGSPLMRTKLPCDVIKTLYLFSIFLMFSSKLPNRLIKSSIRSIFIICSVTYHPNEFLLLYHKKQLISIIWNFNIISFANIFNAGKVKREIIIFFSFKISNIVCHYFNNSTVFNINYKL